MVPLLHHGIIGGVLRSLATHTCCYFGTVLVLLFSFFLYVNVTCFQTYSRPEH